MHIFVFRSNFWQHVLTAQWRYMINATASKLRKKCNLIINLNARKSIGI